MPHDASPRLLRLSADDNVLVAGGKVEAGDAVEAAVVARQRIPFGHKVAARAIGQGEAIRKFGQIIGFASRPIEAGDWVHDHNVGMHDFERDYQIGREFRAENILPVAEQASFDGFRRANGRVGTRNYVGILTSVNCSASVARFIAEAATRSGLLADYPDIDGVVSFTHGSRHAKAR